MNVTPAAEMLLRRAGERVQPELLCEIGSTAHGTGDGNDDFDMMGVYIEGRESVIGTHRSDHVVLSTGDNESQNTHEDADLTLYSLRKFAKLAAAGNPSILNVFFAPVLRSTDAGRLIREAAPLFVSKQAGPRYLGYMKSQMERLKGERGQKRVKRPELEEKFGYDTKYAYHILRLCIQGRELLSTGRISIPMNDVHRDFLVGVRKGAHTLEEFMEYADKLEADLKRTLDESTLPDSVDQDAIDAFLIEMHEEKWYS